MKFAPDRIRFIIILFFAMSYASEMVIYNNQTAYLSDSRWLDLGKTGEVEFTLNNFPDQLIPSTIRVTSDFLKVTTVELYDEPLNKMNLLKAFEGKTIELVKYGEEGEIEFSTEGRLISFRPEPVFEINGKIVVNPPYKYVFPYIPESITESPVVRGTGIATESSGEVTTNYFMSGVSWQADYNLTLTGDDSGILEGWFMVTNNTRHPFEDVQLSFVSGDVAFSGGRRLKSERMAKENRAAEMIYFNTADASPQLVKLENYQTFKIPYSVSIPASGEKQIRYLEEKRVTVKPIYSLEHQLGRHYSGMKSTAEAIPVNIQYQISADDIGDYNLPAGQVFVYEQTGDDASNIFVGSNRIPVIQKGDDLKIRTGATKDVTVKYRVIDSDAGKMITTLKMEYIFRNTKDKPVTVELKENISGREWKFRKKSHSYEKLDANSVVFSIEVPAEDESVLTFTIDIER